ncbi:MAG: hypothetical protein HC817_16920 [Saprospiraceae bacterium]|nr:hypothetical protein [Saprospiraceae bacterium]
MHSKILHKVLFLFFSILSLTSTAQIQKGAKTIGFGSFQQSFSRLAYENITNGATSKVLDFNLNIRSGQIDYMLTDRFQIGSGIGFSFFNQNQTFKSSTSSRALNINDKQINVDISPSIAYFFSKNRDFFLAFDAFLSLNLQGNRDLLNTYKASLGYVKPFPENAGIFWRTEAGYSFGNYNSRASVNLGMTHFIPAILLKTKRPLSI